MTEGVQEPYVGLVDARFDPFHNHNCVYLPAPARVDGEMRGNPGCVRVPTFEAVYHPFVAVCSGVLFPSQPQYALSQATAFVWGHEPVLNWQDGQWIGYERSGGWALDLLGRFARERLRAARFLVRGTFEGLLPTGSGAIRTEWRSYNGARLLGMSENEAVLASL